jgi:hypothetical protein
MLRRRRAPEDPLAHIDPAAVAERFAGAVAAAVAARRHYAEVLAGVRPGPVRDALAGAGARLDAGALAVWDIAVRATQIDRTLAALDPDRVADEYKQAKRAGGDPDLEAALAQRFASVQRLLNTLDDTAGRLRLLDARLTATVAGAAEVALGVSGEAGADALGAELDGVVTELQSLRAALDELA